jgi:hypothetical protein
MTRMLRLLKKTAHTLMHEGVGPTARKMVNALVARHQEKHIFLEKNIEARFTKIYKMNYWRSAESVSGGGSTLVYTEKLRKALPGIFAQFSIRSLFDAPCGDFNWMRHFLSEHPMDYIGGDIVRPLIEAHTRQYENATTRFMHIDLTAQPFPAADMMLCRDCLFHLSYDDTKAVLQQFVASNIRYLLTTTHRNTTGFVNQDIATGGFRVIDLFSAPYNFPKDVLARIDDWLPPDNPPREMCLWTREQVITALAHWG